MAYYVVAGSNAKGGLVVLDTYKGWLVYGVDDVLLYACGRHFKSHAESKRAAARALRMYPTYRLVPTKVVIGGPASVPRAS